MISKILIFLFQILSQSNSLYVKTSNKLQEKERELQKNTHDVVIYVDMVTIYW